MKRLLLLTVLFLAFFAQSQSGTMIEGGGPGGYFSVNLCGHWQTSRSAVKWRIGYGTYRLTGVKGNFHPDVIVPLGAAYTLPSIKRLSIGAGVTISGIQGYSEDKLKTLWKISAYESLSFDFVHKEHVIASITAYLLNEPQKSFRPWAGVSFTYLF